MAGRFAILRPGSPRYVAFRALLQKDYLPKGMPKEAYFIVIKKGGNYFLTGVSLHGDRHRERRRDDDP